MSNTITFEQLCQDVKDRSDALGKDIDRRREHKVFTSLDAKVLRETLARLHMRLKSELSGLSTTYNNGKPSDALAVLRIDVIDTEVEALEDVLRLLLGYESSFLKLSVSEE